MFFSKITLYPSRGGASFGASAEEKVSSFPSGFLGTSRLMTMPADWDQIS
jgi:hypothetical protein